MADPTQMAAPAAAPNAGPDWRGLLGKFGTILSTVGKVAAPAYAAGRTGNPAIAQAMWQRQEAEDRKRRMVSELSRIAPNGPTVDNMQQVARVLMKYGHPGEAIQILNGIQALELENKKLQFQNQKEAEATRRWEEEQRIREEKLDLEQSKFEREAENRPRNQDIAALRRVVLPEVTRYKEREAGYQMVQEAQDTPMGDLALINGYVKTIDPGSIVRTEESRMIITGTGVPGTVKNWLSSIWGKGRLSAENAAQIRAQARAYINAARRRHATNMQGWDELASHEQYDNPFPAGWYARPVEPEPGEAAEAGGGGGAADEGWVDVEWE